jgi:hypothetical protein
MLKILIINNNNEDINNDEVDISNDEEDINNDDDNNSLVLVDQPFDDSHKRS